MVIHRGGNLLLDWHAKIGIGPKTVVPSEVMVVPNTNNLVRRYRLDQRPEKWVQKIVEHTADASQQQIWPDPTSSTDTYSASNPCRCCHRKELAIRACVQRLLPRQAAFCCLPRSYTRQRRSLSWFLTSDLFAG